jgi:hypothetical protein
MAAAVNLLEAKRTETYAVLLDDKHDCLAFEAKVTWLEARLGEIYRFAIQQSKGDLTVPEVFSLWDKMVSICDFFIDYVRIMATRSPRQVSFDELLDVRLACDEKREFHRCGK